MTAQSDSELDDILEDLIVGHNFEYARKALLEWKEHCALQKQIEELEDARLNCLSSDDGFQWITNRIAELQAKLKDL